MWPSKTLTLSGLGFHLLPGDSHVRSPALTLLLNPDLHVHLPVQHLHLDASSNYSSQVQPDLLIFSLPLSANRGFALLVRSKSALLAVLATNLEVGFYVSLSSYSKTILSENPMGFYL